MVFIPCLLLSIIADIAECQRRIINGEKGDLSTLPFAVYIENEYNGNWCTGSLISLEWVLSAAHCFVETRYTEEFQVSNYIFIFFTHNNLVNKQQTLTSLQLML